MELLNTQNSWLSLDEYLDIITSYLSCKQRLPFERLSSKLIMTFIETYKKTSTYHQAIDGYWKPENPKDILKLDSRMRADDGWVLFSMKTSTDKKRCLNLMRDSIVQAKNMLVKN